MGAEWLLAAQRATRSVVDARTEAALCACMAHAEWVRSLGCSRARAEHERLCVGVERRGHRRWRDDAIGLSIDVERRERETKASGGELRRRMMVVLVVVRELLVRARTARVRVGGVV